MFRPSLTLCWEERCFRRPEIDIFRTDFGNGRAVGVLAAQKFSPNATALFSIDLVCLYTRSFRSFLNEVPCIFFMEPARVGDVVDFWNLRAMGEFGFAGAGTAQGKP